MVLSDRMLSDVNRIHLMGIGGAGMSGLALLLKELGYDVSGCDVNETSYVEKVLQKGIKFTLGHQKEHIEKYQPDLIVYSSAIPSENEEIKGAIANGISVAKRAEVLSWLFNSRFGIGVAGTHGKTTTSSMIAMVLEQAGLRPSVAIGGELCDIGVNAKLGDGPYMVAELDESDGSFEEFKPNISVVTNADWDHVDHYPDLESVITAFRSFINNTKADGKVILCGEDTGLSRIIASNSLDRGIITYGFGKTWDWGAFDVKHNQGGGVTFAVCKGGEFVSQFDLSVSGDHNILNALAATVVAAELSIPISSAKETLKDFRGAKRRLQYMGHVMDADIYDDYGHHPREVAATLNTLDQMFPDRRHVVVFQPHRYTRTMAMYKEFSDVLSMADRLLLTPIYPADEDPIDGVSSCMISNHLLENGYNKCKLCSDLREAVDLVGKELRENDILLTIGAGNVSEVGIQLLDRLGERD